RSGAGLRDADQAAGTCARFLALLRPDQEGTHRPDRRKSVRAGRGEAAAGADAAGGGGQAEPRPAARASGGGGGAMRADGATGAWGDGEAGRAAARMAG